MASKAQEGLQNLLEIEGQTQSSAANLAKLQEARTQFIASGGDEADFAMPEAMATAIGVGWLLGPVGGLLMGVAQGILGKREEQSLLDQYAADQGVMTDLNDIYNDAFERAAIAANTPEELAQILSWQSQADAGFRMSQGSPELREDGATMMSEAMAGLNELNVTNEVQAIEARAEDARLKRELDDTQYSRYTSSIGSFRAESAGYEGVMQATDIALDRG